MIINSIVNDANMVVSSGWDGKVKVWDVAEKKELSEVDLGGYVNTMSWEPKEERGVVFAGGKGGLLVKIKT